MSGAPDEETVLGALRLAVRAPSVHNVQPWRWRVGPGTVHLHVDGFRQLPATDPYGRDLLISCGAALDHLLVALASLGWGARVRRLPDPARPSHLATVEPVPRTAADRDLAAAIPRRCTDRRRFSSWPVPPELVGEMIELARGRGIGLEAVTEPASRWKLVRAITTAAQTQAADPAYAAELAEWSGRGPEVDDGVPAANAPPPQRIPGQVPLRAYARPSLPELPGEGPPSAGEPENATLLLLSTASDTALDWLRAGEATSAVLLTAARDGLASSPLTQPLEVDDTREYLRRAVATAPTAHPQILLRVGWLPAGSAQLPRTPRRPLADVVTPLSG
jgi:nitroreductase